MLVCGNSADIGTFCAICANMCVYDSGIIQNGYSIHFKLGLCKQCYHLCLDKIGDIRKH